MARHRALAPRGLALAALAALALLAGCARPASGGHTTLEFWAMGREGEVVRDLLPEFERTHPGITVRVQQVPWTAAHEKLLTAYVGNQLPDVAQLGNTWIPEFEAVHALQELDPWLARTGAIRPDDYFPGVWASNVLEKAEGTRTFGVPWYVDTRVLFYRKDLVAAAGFAAAPRTWDEWRRAMIAVKARGGPSATAILLPLDEWAQPVLLGVQAGSPLLRDGDRYGAFAQPEFRRAAAFYVDIFKSGLAPFLASAKVGNLYQQFAAGDFAFYITGPWNLGEFRNRLPAAMQDKWDTAPLPAMTAEEWPGTSLAGGSSLVMLRHSEAKDAAFELIAFLSRHEQQVAFYKATGDLPARRDAWDDPALAGDRRTVAFKEQLAHVRPMPKVPEWEQIATMVAEHVERVVRGKSTLDEELPLLDADVDRALAKRRWVIDQQKATR